MNSGKINTVLAIIMIAAILTIIFFNVWVFSNVKMQQRAMVEMGNNEEKDKALFSPFFMDEGVCIKMSPMAAMEIQRYHLRPSA